MARLSNPYVDLYTRHHDTAKELLWWSQRKIGNIKEQLLLANEVILQLDRATGSCVLSESEIWLRRALKKRMLGLVSLQRTITRQHSRLRGRMHDILPCACEFTQATKSCVLS